MEELQEAENSSDGSDEPYSMDLEADTDKLMQKVGEGIGTYLSQRWCSGTIDSSMLCFCV